MSFPTSITFPSSLSLPSSISLPNIRIPPLLTTTCGVVGSAALLSLLYKTLKLTFIYIRPSGLHRYAHPTPDGQPPWALVTGASDGIGTAYAHELAAKGFNVVIHGRNPEKLRRVLSQLQAAFPQRSFRILVADASTVACVVGHSQHDGSKTLDFDAIARELDDINLTVLVNNAGGGATNPRFLPLSASSEERITGNVSLNGLFPLHLTRALLPNLTRHQPSLVINMSSMGDGGFPLIAVYSASKAFFMTATRCLRLEMKMEGRAAVEILGIRVGRVTGASDCKEPPTAFLPSTQTMARAALARAGHDNGVVEGYWAHALQEVASSVLAALPRWVQDKVSMDVMHKMRRAESEELKEA
ncbi:putative oxidoreductase,short chain dehydrogenase [Hypoxylon fragiforme]|uniref:putative oxidoreductase,short chain dehydrogenase n=1 Tax=Hypoxylon fragiforme TaxID=63214 RepID=UPI0020C5E868|nr:putative oxidoreductase,short chain dehydrogenase [Hypoxylon fragiforme]KAI2605036.1 putative oxidoreductase,short chain dehydrogenase [Hypoxylon fragiforme]